MVAPSEKAELHADMKQVGESSVSSLDLTASAPAPSVQIATPTTVGYHSWIASVVQEVTKPTVKPTCSLCKKPWRWPRNLAHVSRASAVPNGVTPKTKFTVVAHITEKPNANPRQPTICLDVFRKLEFTQVKQVKPLPFSLPYLVREFEYHKTTGEVRYAISHGSEKKCKEDYDYAYARLITLSTWYMSLAKCLGSVALRVLDYHANLILVIEMTFGDDPEYREFNSRYLFTILWVMIVTFFCLVAKLQAQSEWAVYSGPTVGDLPLQAPKLAILKAYLSMIFFSLVSVPNEIKQIVITLHPWKSVQPFAAIKMDGVRAYVVGYKDATMFRVENHTGHFFSMLAHLALITMVFTYKVYLFAWLQNLDLALSCLSSVGVIMLGWYEWLSLLFLRDRLAKDLMKTLRPNERGASKVFDQHDKSAEEMRRERESARNVWVKNFWSSPPGPRNVDTSKNPLAQSLTSPGGSSPEGTCRRCGRRKECRKCGCAGLSSRECANCLKGPVQTLQLGSKVRLSTTYENFHDAGIGPLLPGLIGEVVEVGANINDLGQRCCVQAGEDSIWWYDAGALEVLQKEEDLVEVRSAQVAQGEEPQPEAGSKCQGQGGECGGGTEELAELLKRIQRLPTAELKELVRAGAELLADAGVNQDDGVSLRASAGGRFSTESPGSHLPGTVTWHSEL